MGGILGSLTEVTNRGARFMVLGPSLCPTMGYREQRLALMAQNADRIEQSPRSDAAEGTLIPRCKEWSAWMGAI